MNLLGPALMLAALGAGVIPATAADLAVPTRTVVRTQVAAVDCLRWIRQNQSWYNYCGPIVYPPRVRWNDTDSGPHLSPFGTAL
jgi:hypothetical protein